MVPQNNHQLSRPYLSFRLGGELFGSWVGKVLEILEVPRITRVPHAPAYMRGIINLRGSVLPVIDTRTKFGLGVAQETIHSCIVVLQLQVESETLILGALVDSVQEVLEINQQQIKSAPNVGARYQAEFIEGIVQLPEDFLMLLDVEKVFSSDELLTLQESTTAPVNG